MLGLIWAWDTPGFTVYLPSSTMSSMKRGGVPWPFMVWGLLRCVSSPRCSPLDTAVQHGAWSWLICWDIWDIRDEAHTDECPLSSIWDIYKTFGSGAKQSDSKTTRQGWVLQKHCHTEISLQLYQALKTPNNSEEAMFDLYTSTWKEELNYFSQNMQAALNIMVQITCHFIVFCVALCECFST